MNGLLLGLLLAGAAAAGEARKAPEPLPAKPPEDDFRVVVDEGADEKEPEEPEAPAAGPRGVKRRGLGRLSSVDAKERRIVLETEDGEAETLTVPDAARLSFAPDERPLKLEQLRRGDAVSFTAEGGKAARLHLDLCAEGGGGGDEDLFAPAPRRARPRGRRPPPPPADDEGPEYPSADEPDTPMYQSEPPEPPPAPKAPAKK